MELPILSKPEIPKDGWFTDFAFGVIAGDDDMLYWALTGKKRE